MSRTTLANKVYNKLYDKILNGDYSGGASLNEAEIANEFNMSRTPVREAFRRLEKDMLVVSKPGRGVFVIEPSIKDVIEIIQIRQALEGTAARLATDQAEEGEMTKILELFPEIDDFLVPEQYPQAFEAGQQLHEFIINNCGNERLKMLIANMQIQFEMTTRLNASIQGRFQKAYREHTGILKAMLRRDGQAAEIAMREHMDNVMKSFLGI